MVLTYSRIAVAPVIVGLSYLEAPWAGWSIAIVFVLASITDWFDGYFARLYQIESTMGKFMDPIADKILVLAALIMLMYLERVGPLMVFIFLARDIFIGGLRSVAAANQVIIAAKPSGKWKTGLQMFSIPCIFIYDPLWGLPIYEIGYYGLWLSVILSLFSGAQYTWGYLSGRKQMN